MTFLRWHLGLGDALLCCGLVRALAAQGRALALPCYNRNRPSVAVLFEDLIKLGQVKLVIAEGDRPAFCEDELALGYYGGDFDDTRFDWSFYQQAEVPFIDKWERFKVGGSVADYSLPTDYDRPPFIHDDEARGFKIEMQGYRPTFLPTIFHHAAILEESHEIHCINSCFAIYADLAGFDQRRVLHRYARPDGAALPLFGQKWEIIANP